MTLDHAERILSLPTQVSQRAILLATGQKQREKSQHLSPPEALGDNAEGEKKATQHLCLLRFKHAAFFALPSTFSPPLLPKGYSTAQSKAHSWQAANSLGLPSWQHIKK